MKVHYGWLTGQQRSYIKPSKKSWPIGQPGAKLPLQIPFVTKNGGPYPICDPSNMADNLMKSRILCLLIYLISIPRFAKKSRNYTWRLADPQNSNLTLTWPEPDPNSTRTKPELDSAKAQVYFPPLPRYALTTSSSKIYEAGKTFAIIWCSPTFIIIHGVSWTR